MIFDEETFDGDAFDTSGIAAQADTGYYYPFMPVYLQVKPKPKKKKREDEWLIAQPSLL